MSNLYEYKELIDKQLHSRIFLNDPLLLDSNIYINRDFSGTIQQLFIVSNWETLRKKITDDELWAMLKLHEYRSSKIVFDSSTGSLIADVSAQALYKKYYRVKTLEIFSILKRSYAS